MRLVIEQIDRESIDLIMLPLAYYFLAPGKHYDTELDDSGKRDNDNRYSSCTR